MGNNLTDAENAALVLWTNSDHTHDAFMAAVRQAIGNTERRHNRADDVHIAFLRAELAAIRDLAYCGSGSPADAVEAIRTRANRALDAEAAR
jgi:hypothetical protein